MTFKEIIPTFLLIIFCSYGMAQKNFADDMFEQKKYEKALRQYNSAYEKDPQDLHIIQRVGLCYYLLGNYSEALGFFKKATSPPYTKRAESSSFFYLGKCLKSDNRIFEARQQFQIYVNLENNPKGKIELESCNKILDWTKDSYEYQVQNLSEINTEYIEMGPSMMNGLLTYTSDREKKDRKQKQLDALSIEPSKIYIYSPSDPKETIKEFSDVVNTKNEGEGPGYFNKEGNVLFYTKVFKDESKPVNQMEMHLAEKEGGKWQAGKDFRYNSLKYSVGYPVISPVLSKEGNLEIFIGSDKPNGDGKWNIFITERTGAIGYKAMSELPENVNTAKGNEFPTFVDENGRLYFVSDYLPGYGGLDIFYTDRQIDGTWSDPVNLGRPFNSGYDDHYFIKTGENTGYFASNRLGGKGDYDLYSFEYHPYSEKDAYKNLSGKYTDGNNPISGATLLLQDESGIILRSVETDNAGAFKIPNVPQKAKYKINVDADPATIPASAEITITNDDNGKSTLTQRLQNGSFKFESLPLEGPGELATEEIDDSPPVLTASLPTITIMGQLKGDKDVSNKRVYVIGIDGSLISSTNADHLGKFKFEELPADEQYLFTLEDDDSSIKLSIINKNGQVIGQTRKNTDGQYVYHKFSINPSDKPDIRGVFKYGELPADGISLLLLDEDGQMVQFTVTDDNGGFEFARLDPGRKYSIKIEGDVATPDNAQMYIIDKTTGILIPVSKLASGLFNFETLAPMQEEELELMEEEDYDFKPLTDLTCQVYSKSKEVPAGMKVNLVDKNGKIIAVAKTNNRGSFKFFNLPMDDQYLFQIPEDDESFAIRIWNSNNELAGVAKKENNQYVYYKFNSNPSQRPDIRGLFKYNNLPANDVLLNLMDEGNNIVQFTRTNAQGEFEFKDLYGGKTYRIEVDASEGEIPDNSSMYIIDSHTGFMLPVSKLGNGSFKFETLKPIAPEELELMDDGSGMGEFSFFARIIGDNTEGKEVEVFDSNGKLLGTATADRFGKFQYRNLPLKDQYLLKMPEGNSDYNLSIISKSGDDISTLDKNDKGEFVFDRADLNSNIGSGGKNTKNPKVISEKFISTLYFNFNMSQLTGDQLRNLNYLADYMLANPDKSVTINSHTDSKGRAEYNMELSEKRAENVKRYLKNKGISEGRITTNSYGETQPLNECSDGVECPEEKHAANRRVELVYSQ